MTENEIEAMLRAYIASQALRNVDTIRPDDDLLASGIIDSMGVMKLVSFIEDELGVRVDDDDIVADNFRSLRAISDFAVAKQSS